MIRHKNCAGWFELYDIREHNFSFMQCSECGYVLGGEKEKAKINRLMGIKVRPTIRKAG